jgi:hypothetical protein
MHGKRPCSEINSGQYKFLHDSSLFLDRTCHGGGEFYLMWAAGASIEAGAGRCCGKLKAVFSQFGITIS